MGGLVAACRSIDICKDPHPAVLESGRPDPSTRRNSKRWPQLNEEAPYVRIHPMRSSETVRDRQRPSEIVRDRLVSATCALLVRLFCHVFLDTEGLVGSVGVVGSLIASS